MVGQVVLVIAALGIAIPTLWVFVASFKDKSEFYGSPWTWPKGLHWQNYADAFVDAKLGQYFGTSVLVTVMSMAMVLVIALPCSYVLARFDFPGKKILKLAVQAGLFINVNYIVVPIFLMLVDADKLLYNIMPNGFFVNNVFILALVYASTSLPFTIFLLQDFFASIPKDYEEAAMIDGASQTRIMTRIFFPMAMPAISMSMLFNFLTYWNDYIISMTLMTGNNRTVQVGLLNLMQTQKAATNYGRLYAGMVIVMVPVLIFYAVVQKKLLETSTMGGIK
ncbi:carbohydrate ABC transporter permease [Bifidobacterium longum subsp. infantis]|nr:carbohydrate ABC transporter permease [Bifidobacterium longum subsp. infantis]MSR95340.1 carbohydrate ABC transporter permease [Bifidobacterium sp. WCA-178-WT-4B]BAJ68492.1 putative ABC transporter permease component [Bifidobacterium longum subsp. infantis ATCC 15697 = JCM 1222 = DSM 20088]MED7620237.1 carbohydrate ABC transporter permease [Bifidobacterium longum subsp. infantis]NQX50824.1 carbohydrate ABC transporter permease [Bifidobacterium longum subsp. infantis]